MALPKHTDILTPKKLPPLPKSWSELTWQQLLACWQVKMRYGGNQDVARAAALLDLCGLTPAEASEYRSIGIPTAHYDGRTGEAVYLLRDGMGGLWKVTPRELSQMAAQALPWFDYPYGDPGKPAVKDDDGNVIEEAVAPVSGYVSNMRDSLILPEETVAVPRPWYTLRGRRWFALPQLACNNLTWQQYRSLQALSPQLFGEDVGEDEARQLQAEFLSHCLVPRTVAILDTAGGSIRIRPHYDYRYDTTQAEGLVAFWRERLSEHPDGRRPLAAVLFHICFQAYQTALTYYSRAYPLLFNGDGKEDPMRDALQGEVGTINTIMKYAGYAEQQQVYDSNMTFVLDILNTMAKEAKEIEKMNQKIKSKRH